MLNSVLFLFDLDDTLLITDAKIILRDPVSGEVKHRLSTDQYRDMKKSKGEGVSGFDLDFSEFNNTEKVCKSFLQAKAGPGLPILRDAIETADTEIGILTARSSEEAVEAALPGFLAKEGIDISIDPDLIFAARDPKYHPDPSKSDSELKLAMILAIIEEGIFDSISLIDDDPMHKRVIDAYCESHKIQNIHVIPV